MKCCLVRRRYKAARQVDLEAQQRRPEAAAHSVLSALGPIALKAFGALLASRLFISKSLTFVYAGVGKSMEVSPGEDSPWKRPRRTARTASSAHEMSQTTTSLSLDALEFELHPQAKIQDASRSSWPTEPVLDAVKWLRGIASTAPAVGAGVSVRIVVAGGAQTIHHVLNAIELLRAELLRSSGLDSRKRQLSVSIFLIPISPSVDDNALAECIARTDCW